MGVNSQQSIWTCDLLLLQSTGCCKVSSQENQESWAASAWGVRADQRVLVSGGAEWGARAGGCAGPGFGVETQAARSVAGGWRGEE